MFIFQRQLHGKIYMIKYNGLQIYQFTYILHLVLYNISYLAMHKLVCLIYNLKYKVILYYMM